MTADNLFEYVGAGASQTAFVASCWDQAVALIDGYVGTAEIDTAILDRAYLELGAELFHRKATKNAVAQFATPDAPPIRIARDPMVAVYPLLDRALGRGGFA